MIVSSNPSLSRVALARQVFMRAQPRACHGNERLQATQRLGQLPFQFMLGSHVMGDIFLPLPPHLGVLVVFSFSSHLFSFLSFLLLRQGGSCHLSLLTHPPWSCLTFRSFLLPLPSFLLPLPNSPYLCFTTVVLPHYGPTWICPHNILLSLYRQCIGIYGFK